MSFEVSAATQMIDNYGPRVDGASAFAEAARKVFQGTTPTEVIDFLDTECFRPAVLWADIGATVWPNEATRAQNRFPFLQGDIVRTSLVQRLAHGEMHTYYKHWLICSPTCDAVRAAYVRVAPLLPLMPEEKGDNLNRFKLASRFRTPKWFPVPPYEVDQKPWAYYADLVEPFFIQRRDADAAIAVRSMTLRGWYLFTMVVQQSANRPNIQEETMIRS